MELLLTNEDGNPMWRNRFNDRIWNPARKAAGVTKPTRQDGTHALRHHYASVLLDAGESIKELSEYLGHHDPGFTLRTYTHLMPNSSARTQRAIDSMFSDGPELSDGPNHGPEARSRVLTCDSHCLRLTGQLVRPNPDGTPPGALTCTFSAYEFPLEVTMRADPGRSKVVILNADP